MSIAANKVPGARAALVFDEKMAALARQHNNANVLCLGGKFVSPDQAKKIVDAFLDAHFEGGRHERPVTKVERLQNARRERRSEEHTAELQSPLHLLFRLLLEKKE